MLAGVVVLPLIFIPGIDDEYALPKTVALRILALVGGVVFFGYLMVGGLTDRSADATVDVSLWCFVGLYIVATLASVNVVKALPANRFSTRAWSPCSHMSRRSSPPDSVWVVQLVSARF